LTMHRDVVLEVGVREENIGMVVLHLLEEAGEVRGTQVKFLAKDDLEISRVLLNPFVDAFAIINAVIRVLESKGELQPLLEFPMIDETSEELGSGNSRRG